MDWPKVAILVITYKRTALAARTIQGVLDHLVYPHEKLRWHIADDGSPEAHIVALKSLIDSYPITISNTNRRGVGASMNVGSIECLKKADYILWLEDDWELTHSFDLRPCVELLSTYEQIGMVRLGYISPGIVGTLVSGNGHLWWRLDKGPTYTFTGHASLRHRRFLEAYMPYREDLTPGETELHMCGTFNNKPGPGVVYPAYVGEYGPFAHIGGDSLKDVRPNTP